MKNNILVSIGACFAILACAASVQAAKSRDLVVEENVNDYSKKAVFVDLDRKDRVYAENELLTATVKSDTDGFLYLLHIDSKGKKSVLFPNQWFNDNRIKANESVQYPAAGAKYRFRISGPNFGKERIVAFVTEEELKSIRPEDFAEGALKALDDSTEHALVDELTSRKDLVAEAVPDTDKPDASAADYAMHYVDFETTAKRASTSTAKGKAWAICVGIGEYSDSSIRSLNGCVEDAEKMAEIFQKYCGVAEKDCLVLCNEKATLENIKTAFVELLAKMTSPDDVVYVYWSGHGHSIKGVASENNSDRSEYLIPYDADLSSPSKVKTTLLHEDTFGAWVRLLSGRNVLVFLDACHSFGMANSSKSLVDSDDDGLVGAFDKRGNSSSKSVSSKEEPFRFGTKAFSRSKALGQSDLYVLASSTQDQLSMVRKEGDMSVMTYALAETIEKGRPSMTHKDLFAPVKKSVDAYMEANYPGRTQAIVEQDELNPGLKLKK